MNNEEYKILEEKIHKLMDSISDKNNDDYQQVEKMLIRHGSVMLSIRTMSDVKIKQYPKMSVDLIDKRLSMEKIAEACISFQQISNTPETGKLFFDYLMHPVSIRMNNLIGMEKVGLNLLNDEGRRLLLEQKKKLRHEIIKGCSVLQERLISQEVANHVLEKSLKICNRANPEEVLTY
jgi:hypothetical protein